MKNGVNRDCHVSGDGKMSMSKSNRKGMGVILLGAFLGFLITHGIVGILIGGLIAWLIFS